MKSKKFFKNITFFVFFSSVLFSFCGCSGMGGYCGESLFPDEVQTVYVEMFDNRSFRRGVEYELTDALAKHIEATTPYKIISNKDKADTVLSGQILSIGELVLVSERETGRALEKEVLLSSVVSWKNLKTGELLLDNTQVSATSTYSQWQNQGFSYASTLAANKLAKRIVEQMEKEW